MTCLGITITGDLSIGDVVVGIGTLVMAFFTARLARSTAKSVESAEDEIRLTTEQVEISRRSMEAQSQPFIVPTESVRYAPTVQEPFPQPVEFTHYDGEVCLMVRLWNVGSGPAIVHELSMRVNDAECLDPLDEHVLIDVKIAVSDQRRPLRIAQSLATNPGTLTIGYLDASGVKYQSVCDFDIASNGSLRFLSYVQRHL